MNAAAVNLFEQCTRLDALDRAWARVRANGGCAGGDGVPIPKFQAQSARRLILLSRAIRTGRYRPAPIRLIGIPKPNGDLRQLAIPSIVDRVAQTAVADVLTPILDLQFADESFAYRPGRSVQQAVRRVSDLRATGFDWVVDGDIERYFDNVPHPPLIDKLEAALEGHDGVADLLDLISRWLAAAAEALDTPDCGLPQGSPLSPLLANLYLDAIDDAFAADRRVRLVRFADDFVILTRRPDDAAKALEDMRQRLAQHGLVLHPEKTRIVDFDRGFRFLGHLFVRSMVLQQPREQAADAAADPIAELLRWTASQDAAAQAGEEERERLELAQLLVDGRIRNQRALLHRLNRQRKRAEVTDALRQMQWTRRKVPGAADVPACLGHEGEAGALYWPALGRMLEGAWALPEGGRFVRSRRPPMDGVNLVLNYLAGLLTRDLGVLVLRRGLHPGFGALHTARDYGEACVYDLIEAFRAPLAEGLAVYLCNSRQLRPDMFAAVEGGGNGVRVSPEGRTAIVRGYQRWVARPVKSPESGKRVTWRRLMEEQVNAYARHVRQRDGEETAAFRPYRMDY